MRQRNEPRRGQATILGGVMFLLIAVLLTGYLLEMFSIQREMNLRDAQANQERLDISDVFFGAEAEYTSPNATSIQTGMGTFNTSIDADPYFAINSTDTDGVFNPLGNGDFTSGTDGWFFTYSYVDASYGAAGAWTTEPTGAQTGPGAVWMDFYFNPDPGNRAYATLNWSSPVYFDLEAVGVASIDDIFLNYGFFTTIHDSVQSSTLNVYLVNSTNEFLIDSTSISGVDDQWQIVEDEDLTSAIGSSGWYTLVFSADIELRHAGSGRPEFRLFLDDVEFEMNFQAHVMDWNFTYTLNQDSTTLSDLEMVFSSHYNTSAIQSIYIIDRTSDRSVPLSRSSMSDSDVKLTFPISGSDIQNYIDQSSNNITFRIYSVSSNPFQHMGATPTLDVAFTGTKEKILISLRNFGGVSFTVKSIWINDYSGHTQKEVDLRVNPGDIYTYQAAYNWTAGEFTIKVITAKGSKATTTATAR
jgi:type II secretory pathway pseudopilin PulG